MSTIKFQIMFIPLFSLMLVTSLTNSMDIIRTKTSQYEHSGFGELKIDFSASQEVLSANSEEIEQVEEKCPKPDLTNEDLEDCKSNRLPQSYGAKCWINCMREFHVSPIRPLPPTDPFCDIPVPDDECEIAFWDIKCTREPAAVSEVCLLLFD